MNTSETEIVGRDDELGLITALLEGTRSDGAGSLLLSGEPGVGKTMLLDAAQAMAARRGYEVVRVTGVQFAAEVSFAALSQVLLGMDDELRDVSDAYRIALEVVLGHGAGPTPTPLLVGNAVLAVLERRARHRPVLLLVDDLQWLDVASAATLMLAARRISSSTTCLLAAARTGFDVDGGEALPVHYLAPLRRDAAAALISSRFPQLPWSTRQRLLSDAKGNPLALIEFGAVANDDHRSVDGFGDARPLSQRLRAIYAGRISALPSATRDAMLLAALHGAEDAAVLRAAAGVTLSALAPAEHQQLISVQESSGCVVFHHPVIRSTVVELASDVERRRAHYALAAALIDEPERRAWHLAAATDQPDEDVAALLERTADENLRKGDPAGAAAALSRSSELTPALPARSRRVIKAASLHAEVTGELRRASELLGSALRDRPELTDSLQASVATSRLLINAECDVDTAHHLLVTAIDKHPRRRDPTDETLADALHSLLLVCWMSGRAEMWAPLDAAIARLEPAAPTVLLLCRSALGDPAHDVPAILDRFEPVMISLPYELNPVTISRIGLASVFTDRLSECREACDRVIQDGRQGGAIALAIQARLALCLDDWQTGQWDEADRRAREGVALCQEHGYRRYSYLLGGYIRGLVAAGRGAEDAATAATELTEWAERTRCGIAAIQARYLRILIAAGNGDFELAYREANAISPAGELAPFAPFALAVLFDLVEAAVRTGRISEARSHVAVMLEAGIARISSRLAMVVGACEALTAEPEQAAVLFERALATQGAGRWPLDQARIQMSYGEHLRQAYAPEDGAVALKRALCTFQALHARPWERRAAAALRATGLPMVDGRTESDVALTSQDLEIATLAASGLTNKQIAQRLQLSPRTVGGHLYRLFPVLGISSRAALHDALSAIRRIDR